MISGIPHRTTEPTINLTATGLRPDFVIEYLFHSSQL